MLWSPESPVVRYAREAGCLREEPFTALCVSCPLKAECPVPRIPLILWTSRLTVDMGQADAIFYFNELALSSPTEEPKTYPKTGITTVRANAVEVRCGDILVDPAKGKGVDASLTINLLTYLDAEQEMCQKHVLVEGRHLRCMQYSNYGRKGILAVQSCSQDCAERLTSVVNRNWRTMLDLLRQLRPLRRAGKRSID